MQGWWACLGLAIMGELAFIRQLISFHMLLHPTMSAAFSNQICYHHLAQMLWCI